MNKHLILSGLSTLVATVLLTACSGGGGYYQDDGPPSGLFANSNYSNVPDAVPKYEKPHSGANKPYVVGGKRYVPVTGDKPMTQKGTASWYGKKFHGKKTSTGETYNMYAMTAAHTTMELPSYAKVTNLKNGKSVIVRVNDRGPFVNDRIIDLSYAAANKLGYVKNGTTPVKIERIRMADIKNGRSLASSDDLIKIFDDSKITDTSADAAAIASVIGVATDMAKAAKETHESQTRLLAKGQSQPISSNSIVIEPATTTSFTLDDTPDDLQGAVNLTEAAKYDMVSTEVDLSEMSVSPHPSDVCWGVQLGAFGSQTNAQNYAETMQVQLNQPINIQTDGNLFRVMVGKFNSKEEASSQALTLGEILGKKLVPIQIH